MTEQIVKLTKNTKTTADGLAACFGLSRPRIVQLANEGVLVRDENSKYNLTDNILRYINSKSGGNGELSFDAERTKHEKFKSRLTELRLAKLEARMHDAKDIEFVMTEMLTNLRTQLLGLPSQLSGQMANQSQDIVYQVMTKAIESKLSELADYTPELFCGDDDEEEDS
jgi:hypothetical protein